MVLSFHVDFKDLNIAYNVIIQPRIFVLWFLNRQMDKDFINVSKVLKKISNKVPTTFSIHQIAKIFNIKHANWRPLPSYIWDPDKDLRATGAYGGVFYAGLSPASLMGFNDTALFGFDAFTLKSYFNLRWYEARHENFITEIDEKAVSFL